MRRDILIMDGRLVEEMPRVTVHSFYNWEVAEQKVNVTKIRLLVLHEGKEILPPQANQSMGLNEVSDDNDVHFTVQAGRKDKNGEVWIRVPGGSCHIQSIPITPHLSTAKEYDLAALVSSKYHDEETVIEMPGSMVATPFYVTLEMAKPKPARL
ncbi:hypothetical protein B0T16DRAFT_387967 [Cercophora newfieldiana]|uniref:Uncharacterized protein n=1 Tax=Cercophora newfieldiana TaxID=92897 RepID=A0AA39YHN4_9PEZI|nr:hypothetical protein B0T16DRAFT_387967 [Cercophora newfieldiana]